VRCTLHGTIHCVAQSISQQQASRRVRASYVSAARLKEETSVAEQGLTSARSEDSSAKPEHTCLCFDQGGCSLAPLEFR
jgi:hypothetical protein